MEPDEILAGYDATTTESGRFVPLNRKESLGWIQPTPEHPWQSWLQLVRAYVDEHGSADVKQLYVTQSGAKLGQWVSNRRSDYKKNKLSDEWVEILESLSGWVWGHEIPGWDQFFPAVKAYAEKHGNVAIPADYRHSDLPLTSWISRPRLDMAARRGHQTSPALFSTTAFGPRNAIYADRA